MSKRILIVEDEEDNRRIIRDVLAHAGFEIDEAATGEEAIASVSARPPDLILMDIQLPGRDGYATTRHIRTLPELQQVPVIAVTSFALVGDDTRAREAGCNDYIAKPYSPRALVQKVRDLLG